MYIYSNTLYIFYKNHNHSTMACWASISFGLMVFVVSAGVIFFISPVEAENKWSKVLCFAPKTYLPIL